VIIGLGKTGYSCARYFKSQDILFEVVDQDESPSLLSSFNEELPDVNVITGKLDQKVLLHSGEIVVSPGVPLNTHEIQKAVDAGIKVTGDIDIFSKIVDKPVIAITGSNGKSTVTTLVGQMAEDSGIETGTGGNLGLPALDLLSEGHDLYVLELSSFQLETTRMLGADVAAVINLSPDHLDRYPSESQYYATKAKVFQGCKQAVINRDEAFHFDIPQSTTIWSFGIAVPASDNELGLIKRDNHIFLAHGSKLLLPIEELKIRGKHNCLNALASLAIGFAFGLPLDEMLKTLVSYNGLAHRCEWVASIDGVDFFNDSKATNVGATVAAIKGLGEYSQGKIILIAGGVSKEADFTPLKEPAKTHVRNVISLGQDADSIDAVLNEIVPLTRATDLDEAVDLAIHQSNKGDIVLLSPACASLDMFRNFEQRGDLFKKLVTERG